MPQSALEKFLDRIAKGEPIPALVLLGSDPYLRERCRNALIARYVPEGAREWAVTKTSARGRLEEFLERARMMPMLSPLQILILQDADALESGGEEAVQKTTDALAAYLDNPAPFSIVVFEAGNLDRRRKLFKILSEGAVVADLTPNPEDAVGLAAEMARELGAQLDSRAAAELVEAVNGEPARVQRELEKLALYAAGRNIEVADVDALVVSSRKSTVWKLAEVLAARDRRAGLEFLDTLLREGEQAAGIVGALAWMYRKLIEASELPPRSSPYQAARELAMRPDTAAIALAQARQIPRGMLLSGIVALAEADNTLKSGVADPRAVMEFLVARLTAPVPVAAAGSPASYAPRAR